MNKHFKSASWSKGLNIYEVNIRQYTPEGNFNSFTMHLDRLADMGVKVLWMMPITPISRKVRQGSLGSYYACSSYTKINPEYGNLEDFKTLVKSAHEKGMKVIIDWVANHTGWDHEWTVTHPEWYIRDEQGNFTERNGWHDVIDLNYQDENMQSEMIRSMQFWIRECNIDGFRCDMAHLVPINFWQAARSACDAIKELFWLGETEDMQHVPVFDATYAWEWMHISELMIKGKKSVQDFYQVLHHYSQYPSGCSKLYFTSNHDENSWNGTEYEKYGDAAKVMAMFTATWNGIPLVYSGQELPNHKRLKFFDKDLIEWNGTTPSLHEFYKNLLHLSVLDAIHSGETFILPTQHQNVVAYLRIGNSSKVLVLLNFGYETKVRVEIAHEKLSGAYHHFQSGLTFQFSDREGYELEAFRGLIYVSKH